MHHRVTELLFKPYSVNKTPNNTGLPQRQQRLMEVKRDPKELTCQTRHPILDHFDGHLKESCHMVRQGAAFWLALLLLPPIHIDQSYNMNTHTHTPGVTSHRKVKSVEQNSGHWKQIWRGIWFQETNAGTRNKQDMGTQHVRHQWLRHLCIYNAHQ